MNYEMIAVVAALFLRVTPSEVHVASFRASSESILAIAASKDEKTIGTVGEAGAVDLWDVASRKRIARLASGFTSMSASFSVRGQFAACDDHRVAVWDVDRKTQIMEGKITVAAAPHKYARRDEKSKKIVWEERTTADLQPVSVAFSPDGNELAAGYTDGVIRLWDIRRAKVSRELRGHEDPVTYLFSASYFVAAR